MFLAPSLHWPYILKDVGKHLRTLGFGLDSAPDPALNKHPTPSQSCELPKKQSLIQHWNTPEH